MIIAWIAFICGLIALVMLTSVSVFLAICAYAQKDAEYASSFVKCSFGTVIIALLTAISACYIWGGGL